MLRWNSEKEIREEIPQADAFIAEILAVCKKHNISISHEDGHGGFLLEMPYSEENARWFAAAAWEGSRY